VNDEEVKEFVHLAVEHGSNIGQVSLAQFILKEYGHELSPKFRMFLDKVCQNSYEDIGNTLSKPAEDIALQVAGMIATKLP
jgi:hypothetical protein